MTQPTEAQLKPGASGIAYRVQQLGNVALLNNKVNFPQFFEPVTRTAVRNAFIESALTNARALAYFLGKSPNGNNVHYSYFGPQWEDPVSGVTGRIIGVVSEYLSHPSFGDGLGHEHPGEWPIRAYTSQGGLLPIVLTEGRFDVEVLSAALRLRRPHLAEYIRFPDFSLRNEGGAAALRQTVRAFASAGIPNRVLALFDNDTAARDVLRSFSTDPLPANIHVACLPQLALAENYPTVGPQGEHSMDVNGLATSIELFLGSDVLADGESYRPVVWGGYVRSMAAYQGEVSDKDAIHTRFREKVELASQTPESMATQEWHDLDLVLDHLIGLLKGAVLAE